MRSQLRIMRLLKIERSRRPAGAAADQIKIKEIRRGPATRGVVVNLRETPADLMMCVYSNALLLLCAALAAGAPGTSAHEMARAPVTFY